MHHGEIGGEGRKSEVAVEQRDARYRVANTPDYYFSEMIQDRAITI